MKSPDANKFLSDALEAAEKIRRFVTGRTFDDYLADDMLRAAVERGFTIIGEALIRLRRAASEIAATIPALARITAFRNVLVHEYANLDDRVVWGIVEAHLPSLRESLENLLKGS